MPHHHGVVVEADGDVVGSLLIEDLRLGVLVRAVRGVPVQMVGCEVQPCGALGTERLRAEQAEAGVGVASAGLLPRFGVSGGYTYGNNH